ncbi:hypothetical protein C038_00469 [Brucella sp. 63/311]|nr:hypothetical protein C038_00469 [Brucella sp. 63/311]
MIPSEPKVGWIFRYSYLWHWQFEQGREEGDKDRPVLVLAITTTLEDGSPVVRVLPVTHTPPQRDDEAIEIPAATKRRLGLDDARSWIVLSAGRDRICDLWMTIAVITVRYHRRCLPRSEPAL